MLTKEIKLFDIKYQPEQRKEAFEQAVKTNCEFGLCWDIVERLDDGVRIGVNYISRFEVFDILVEQNGMDMEEFIWFVHDEYKVINFYPVSELVLYLSAVYQKDLKEIIKPELSREKNGKNQELINYFKGE